MAFRSRYRATIPSASPIASRKPFMNTAPSTASSVRVTASGWSMNRGTYGFSMMWAAASAAESVIVITKSVSAKPSRMRTNTFPRHLGSSSSSIAMLPWPWGLRCATCV